MRKEAGKLAVPSSTSSLSTPDPASQFDGHADERNRCDSSTCKHSKRYTRITWSWLF